MTDREFIDFLHIAEHLKDNTRHSVTSKGRPDMYYDFRIWQYSDKGKVPGIEGNVDMNISYMGR